MKKVISKYTVLIKRLEEENKIETTILDNTDGNMYILVETGSIKMCGVEKEDLDFELNKISIT